MKYKIYGFAHKMAKLLLKRDNDLPKSVKLVSFPEKLVNKTTFQAAHVNYINELEVKSNTFDKATVYPVENMVDHTFDNVYPLSFIKKMCQVSYANSLIQAYPLWESFLERSKIADGYRNAGLHYAGYIKECQEWCLPSWIWTNAALVRYYCASGQRDKAIALGDLIISHQDECGGWIVRNDYSKNGVSPQLAPNDSCYIALNCCLELYKLTHEEKYLESAKRNAQWTIATARPDGMVWFAFDTKKGEWVKNKNIVDTGFTAGLFATLYEFTGDETYKAFLTKFIHAYIKAFYMQENRCFSTAIDENDVQFGGAFGRGQGWALEGLLPAYRVLKEDYIKIVIEDTIGTILSLQLKNGGWPYNLLKPMMGEDCKAVPIIAKCLLDWYEQGDKNEAYIEAAKKALEWCVSHTIVTDDMAGGIFSYTTEGAVVHHYYTSTAFVYGSSYALEVQMKLDKINGKGRCF